MIEIAAWQDAEIPFTVEYARAAFERVRQRAAEGLIALPRVGMGVGGLLLGERTGAGMRVTGTVELPCSHTLGPTFQLTPDEIRQSLELVRSAAAQRSVVGMYCTRTRGALALGTTDRELFGALCPEPWQIVLAVRPALGEPARAAVFFRKDGGLAQGTIKELWEWRPVELDEPDRELPAAEVESGVLEPLAAPVAPVVIPMPAPVPTGPAVAAETVTPLATAPVVPPVVPHTVIEMPRPASSPDPVMTRPVAAPAAGAVQVPPKTSRLEPAAAAAQPVSEAGSALPVPVAGTALPVKEVPLAPPPVPGAGTASSVKAAPPVAPPPRRVPVNPQFVDPPRAPRVAPIPLGGSLFVQPERYPAAKYHPRLIMLAAALVILCVGAWLFSTKDAWLPRPTLMLDSTDNNGMLEIHWNAAAARGLDHASLLINDGGQLDTVALDSLNLMAGSFLYKRKSDRVTVTLDLGKDRARTAFPLEPVGTEPVPPDTVPAPETAAPAGSVSPPGTTLPISPSGAAISPFGNPPAPETADPSPAPLSTQPAQPLPGAGQTPGAKPGPKAPGRGR